MPITSSLSLPSPLERHLPELWSCREIFSGRITFISLGRVSVGLLTARDGTFETVSYDAEIAVSRHLVFPNLVIEAPCDDETDFT